MASNTVALICCIALPLLLQTQCTSATAPSPDNGGQHKTWYVANPSTEEIPLRNNLDFVCSETDCSSIQDNGTCFSPETVLSHASVAMNAYYQSKGRNSCNCYFSGAGLITVTDPSFGSCKYA